MKYEKTLEDAKKDFESSILPGLEEFVRIDNLSPDYDPEWETNGKAEKAGMHLINWAKAQGIKGLKAELYKEPGRTHMVLIEIEPQGIDKTVLLYGHFDKQPPLGIWDEGLHPNKPVIKDGLLYGRGASDDGYALFAIVESIKLIQQQNGKHGRIVVTIESGEESGSPDLVPYLKKLKDRIGNPDLMICMDSGCKDYYSLWLTTSLRGVAAFEVEVECLKESVHSGTGSGVAPDSFTVLRLLLDRLDDPKTSNVVAPLHVEIPKYRIEDAEKVVTEVLTKDPPYNSKITVKVVNSGNGWAAKDMHQSLKKSFSESSKFLFGKDYYNCGEGGSIPFIAELGELYPQCEILVTGVLGPGSNAHCLNECLNLDYTTKMIVALAHAIHDFCNQ